MKKNLYYYKGQNPYPRRKKEAPKPSLLRPLLIIGFLLAVLGFGAYGIYRAVPKLKLAFSYAKNPALAPVSPSDNKKTIKEPEEKPWDIKEIKIECPDADATAFISDEIAKNMPLTDAKARAIKNKALDRFAYIQTLDIKKGVISDKLWASCTVRNISALVMFKGETMFVDSDGFIYPQRPGVDMRNLVLVEFDGARPHALDGTFSALLKELYTVQKTMPFERAVTDEKMSKIKLILPGQSVIIMGGASNIKNKTKTALKILEYCKANNLAPDTLDFSYFKYSKAYLTLRTDKNGKK